MLNLWSYLEYLWMHVSNDRVSTSLQDPWRDVWRSRSKHVTIGNSQRFLQAFWWRYRDGRHLPSSVTSKTKPQRAVEPEKPHLSLTHLSFWPVSTTGQKTIITCSAFIFLFLCQHLLVSLCNELVWFDLFSFFKISKWSCMSRDVNHWPPTESQV